MCCQISIKEARNKSGSVVLVTVINGHTWQGRDPFNIVYPLGNTTQDIDTNEYMWAFFRN